MARDCLGNGGDCLLREQFRGQRLSLTTTTRSPKTRQFVVLTTSRRWTSQRGLVDFSFAVNYALGGLNPGGYHLVNLAIHLATGLGLFALMRRTLVGPKLNERFGRHAEGLAFITSLLWLVHPLNTQAVTYICQRYESAAALMYVLGLYAFCRAAEPAANRRLWLALVVVCYALGLRCKETMITFPLLLLWYDRTFVAPDWRAVWQRKLLYGSLLLVTVLLAGAILVPTLHTLLSEMFAAGSQESVARGQTESTAIIVAGLTPWTYLASQPGVILYYLHLAVWPVGQCLDHTWPAASSLDQVIAPALVVMALLAATAWAAAHGFRAAFLAAAFFLFLAPTSSILPIRDLMVEHRMYLPLAAVVALAVLAVEQFTRSSGLRWAVAAAAGVAVLALGTLTWARNQVYADEITLWTETCQCAPLNPRAHYALGLALNRIQQPAEAIEPFMRSIALDPQFAEVYSELGLSLAAVGQHLSAIEAQRRAVRINPAWPAPTSIWRSSCRRPVAMTRPKRIIEPFWKSTRRRPRRISITATFSPIEAAWKKLWSSSIRRS